MNTTYIDNIPNEVIEKNRATVKKFLSTKESINPNPNSCPDITVYWQQKANGKAFHLLRGEYEIIQPNDTIAQYRKKVADHFNVSNIQSHTIVVGSGKNAKVAYAKYYPEFEMLVFGIMTINTRKIPEEKRNYYFMERYFLFRNCPAPFDVNGDIAFKSKGGKFYSLGFVNFLQHDLYKAVFHFYFSQAIEEFTRKGCNPRIKWTQWTPYTFADYYKVMYPRTSSKSSADISEIVNSLPTVNLNELRQLYPKKAIDVKNSWNNEYHTEYKDIIWTFNILNDNYCVIRQFGGYFEFEEQSRILIDNKGKVTIFKPNTILNGNVVFRVSSSSDIGIPADNVCFFRGFEDMFKFKRLFYISSIINDSDIMTKTNSLILRIIYTLRCPTIEQFYKAGYKYIANYLMSVSAKSDVEHLFGYKKYSKSASIYELSGMNKYQLKLVDKMFEEKKKNPNSPTYIYGGLTYTPRCVIETVQFVAGVKNLSSITDKDSDFYFSMAKRMNNVRSDYREFLHFVEANNSVYTYYRIKNGWRCMNKERRIKPLTPEQNEKDRKNLLKLIRLQEKTDKKGLDEDVFKIFSDTLNLFKQISNTNRPDIDLYTCKDVNELHRYHNMLIEINITDKEARNKEEQERLNKLAAKLYDQRKEKFEYADDNFSIVVPKEMNKITKEGVYLHHCVGGYISRVAEGRTNILFLRKNEEIDIPFFTIEVNNHNEIIQIHGLYNRWLGNEPDAVKFVINWIHEKGIKCPVNIVLNKGQGYSASSSKLDAKEYGLEGKSYV
jgi:hypothetical protein